MYKNKVETNSDWTEKQCQYVTQAGMKLVQRPWSNMAVIIAFAKLLLFSLLTRSKSTINFTNENSMLQM
jgi:hypothetical protein